MLLPQSSVLPQWKVKGTLALCLLLGAINGYDASNIANCQASIFNALGHIEILPWIGMGYSAGVTATMPLFGQLFYLVEFRVLYAISGIIWIIGIVLTESANSMQEVAIGRVLTGVGGGGLTQVVFNYVALLSGPIHSKVMGLVGLCFALGLISGPLVGAGFADNVHTTWRWAIYIPLVVFGVTVPPSILCFPPYTVRNVQTTPLFTELQRIDWVGALLHPAAIITLYLALSFSGPVYKWNSGPAIALWVVWAVVVVVYGAQQWFCIFTTRERRILPIIVMGHRVVGLTTLVTFMSGIAYSVSLYYLPLFYAFSRGYSPIESAVCILPLIVVFIIVVTVSGGLLPVVKRYVLFYVVASPLMLLGGVLMATQVGPLTSPSTVMGLSSLLGFSIGAVLHHGLSVSIAALPAERIPINAMQGMAQSAGTSLGLAISGCVFQNKGFDILKASIWQFGYSDKDIRSVLAGLQSTIWETGDDEVKTLVVEAVTRGIDNVFYVIVAAGAICCLATLGMKWESLDFGRTSNTMVGSDAEIGVET